MSRLKEKLLSNWHGMRILRTGIGIMLIGSGIQMHDWLPGLLGAFFLYQGVADAGCCGAQGCRTPRRKVTKANSVADTGYEEVK